MAWNIAITMLALVGFQKDERFLPAYRILGGIVSLKSRRQRRYFRRIIGFKCRLGEIIRISFAVRNSHHVGNAFVLSLFPVSNKLIRMCSEGQAREVRSSTTTTLVLARE